MVTAFSDYCVYTIVHPDALADAAAHGRPATFRESKEWVTGRQLWRRAQAGLPHYTNALKTVVYGVRKGHFRPIFTPRTP